jgi:hypothetical protein
LGDLWTECNKVRLQVKAGAAIGRLHFSIPAKYLSG